MTALQVAASEVLVNRRAAPADARADREFERLYREHVKDVYRYVLAVLRNQADAEDVTQTTFLNAYRALQRGERPQKPQNWLVSIAHNVCRMRFRESARRPQEVALEPSLIGTTVDDDAPSADEIRQALAHLSFNQRSALILREVGGRSYAEIADILGISDAAVETLIFRARRALREQLEGTLTCSEAEHSISRQLDGRLSRSEKSQLRAHLRECADCQRLARRQRKRRSAVKALGSVPLPPSLSSFFGGAVGGGAAAGAGLVAGSSLAAKAAVALVVGVLAGGLGGGRGGAAPLEADSAPSLIRAATTAVVMPSSTSWFSIPGQAANGGGLIDLRTPAGIPLVPLTPGTAAALVTGVPFALWQPPGTAAPQVASVVATIGGVIAPLGGATTSVGGVATTVGGVTTTVGGVTTTVGGVTGSIVQTLPSGASAPSVSTPAVSTPSVSSPTVSAPTLSTPSVSTPVGSIPSATTPSVTAPSLTTPTVTVPSLTAPSVTAPSLTAPSLAAPTPIPTAPSVSTPSVNPPALPPPPPLPQAPSLPAVPETSQVVEAVPTPSLP
jgi:RNA polymerase sigma factor (sigma-70 family)